MTTECTVETLPLSYWSTLHTVMPHEIVMFAIFSGHGNLIYNIICLLTKKTKKVCRILQVFLQKKSIAKTKCKDEDAESTSEL